MSDIWVIKNSEQKFHQCNNKFNQISYNFHNISYNLTFHNVECSWRTTPGTKVIDTKSYYNETNSNCINVSTKFGKINSILYINLILKFRSARASERPESNGVIKSFCRAKGHGFVQPKDGGEDLFVHISE